MRRNIQRASAVVLATGLLLGACHSSPKTYESKVKISRITLLEADSKGEPQTTDVEFDWVDCPGDQRQTLRSGSSFSKCARKLKVGDSVPVKVLWEWDEHGHYDYHVVELSGCQAPPVDDDDSSFSTVRECQTTKQMDAPVGFHCNLVPEGELVQKCPWFKR